jgi:hypothetical protein
MTIEAEVYLDCDECGKTIDDRDDVVCRKCYDNGNQSNLELLERLQQWFMGASIRDVVTIPAIEAFEIKQKIEFLIHEWEEK